MTTSNNDVTTAEIRSQALEETKIGGDPLKAIALSILYLGEVADQVGGDIHTIGAELGQLATEVGQTNVVLNTATPGRN